MKELKIVEKPYDPNDSDTVQFKINTDSELIETLDALAKKFGVSKSLLTEQALIQYIWK